MLDSTRNGRPRTGDTAAARARKGLLVVGLFVLVLYVIEVINTLMFRSLNGTFGLRPRSLDAVP